MIIPVMALAIGALLIWAGITGNNPLTVVKQVLAPG